MPISSIQPLAAWLFDRRSALLPEASAKKYRAILATDFLAPQDFVKTKLHRHDLQLIIERAFNETMTDLAFCSKSL